MRSLGKLAIVLLALSAMASVGRTAPPGRRDANGMLHLGQGDHNMTFSEQDVEILLDTYPIRKVVDAEKTEFKKMVALTIWTKKQWIHGREMDKWLDPARRKNAVEILKKAHLGGRFNCLYYSTVLSTCGIAVGYRARRVCIDGHVVSEFWSKERKKWIMLDSDANVHFELQGVPMSSYELHQAVLKKKISDVKMIQHKPLPASKKPVQFAEKRLICINRFKLLKFYY
ncbi:MAG: hypothetical protein IH991_07645 [Planctomycetes bacterium]|nr:hypothetical protein [Planctomycetota bacterium]